MIESATAYAILAICILGIIHATKYGAYSATPVLLFGGVSWAYSFFLAGIEGPTHFLIGALLSAMLIGMISLCRQNDIAKGLILVCVADIGINWAGWLLLEIQADLAIYNLAFAALYVWTLWMLIDREGCYGGSRENFNWDAIFRHIIRGRGDSVQTKAAGGRS